MLEKTVILISNKATTGGRGIIRGVASRVHEHEIWTVGTIQGADHHAAGSQTSPEAVDGIIGRISPSIAEQWSGPRRRFLGNVSRVEDIPGANNVTPDDAAIARLAAEHLLEKRLEHFAYFGPSNGRQRKDVFLELVEADHGPAARLNSDETDRALTAQLKKLPRPCGVLAFNDMMAVRLIELTYRAGLEVPRDIAVVGVDNNTLETVFCPVSVSSVAVNFHRIGFEAARALGEVFRGADPLLEPVRIPPTALIERQSTDFPGEVDPIAVQAARIIRRRACEAVRVPELVGSLPVSYRTVDRRFQQEFGRSLQAEITRVRMERARHLLTTTHLPLSTIAERLGYGNTNYFNSTFRRQMGIPPAEYRRTHAAAPNHAARGPAARS